MKKRAFELGMRCWLGTVLFGTVVLRISAADVSFYAVERSLKYSQDTSGPPTAGGNHPYRFAAIAAPAADGSIVSATVAGPVGSPQTLTPDPAVLWLTFNAKFGTEAELDAATPKGTYSFVFDTAHDGQKKVSLTSPAGEFPAALHISNFAAAQAIDSSAAFNLTWDSISGGTKNDYILLLIGEAVSGAFVFRSPPPLQAGALDGTSKAITLPAGLLKPNTQYVAEMTYLKVAAIDLTSYPGSEGLVGFGSVTDFGFATAAASPVFAVAFRQFAQGGKFLGSTSASPTVPAPLNGFRAEVTVTNDSNFPAADQVRITGPAGCGLTNTPCDTAASAITAVNATYFSPRVQQADTAPGGNWLVTYKAATRTLPVPDPALETDLVIPLPEVTLANDAIKSVSWSFNKPDGTRLMAAPAFLKGVHVQALDAAGAFLYDSGPLPAGSSSHTLTTVVNWNSVSNLRFMYGDDRANSYVVGFPKLKTNPFSLSALATLGTPGLALRLDGDVGRTYTLQSSSDLVRWIDILTTNLAGPSVILSDPDAAHAPHRFYRAEVVN
jgi:hypothetical protein